MIRALIVESGLFEMPNNKPIILLWQKKQKFKCIFMSFAKAFYATAKGIRTRIEYGYITYQQCMFIDFKKIIKMISPNFIFVFLKMIVRIKHKIHVLLD